MLVLKKSLRFIADRLNRVVSTISDEVSRNKVNGTYDPERAHHKAYFRRWRSKFQGMKVVSDSKLLEFVENNLLRDKSPQAISNRIKKREKHLPKISKNSIYRFILSPRGRRIEAHRRKRGKRRRQGRKKSKLKNRTFIDKRPKAINERKRCGDTEGDFIVSGKTGKGILLVVVDRKTRNTFLERITTVTIRNVHLAFLKIKARFPEMRTMTTDNDILLQHHKELEKLLGIKIYFCHVHSPWEKGTIENTNKVIRKDVPKGSNISKYSKRFFASLEQKLNDRFMDCLNSLTPQEVLTKLRKRKKRRLRFT